MKAGRPTTEAGVKYKAVDRVKRQPTIFAMKTYLWLIIGLVLKASLPAQSAAAMPRREPLP